MWSSVKLVIIDTTAPCFQKSSIQRNEAYCTTPLKVLFLMSRVSLLLILPAFFSSLTMLFPLLESRPYGCASPSITKDMKQLRFSNCMPSFVPYFFWGTINYDTCMSGRLGGNSIWKWGNYRIVKTICDFFWVLFKSLVLLEDFQALLYV